MQHVERYRPNPISFNLHQGSNTIKFHTISSLCYYLSYSTHKFALHTDSYQSKVAKLRPGYLKKR